MKLMFCPIIVAKKIAIALTEYLKNIREKKRYSVPFPAWIYFSELDLSWIKRQFSSSELDSARVLAS
jgi:hypothetical protein